MENDQVGAPEQLLFHNPQPKPTTHNSSNNINNYPPAATTTRQQTNSRAVKRHRPKENQPKKKKKKPYRAQVEVNRVNVNIPRGAERLLHVIKHAG